MDNFDIIRIINEERHIRKFDGVTPEGFVLVHEKTLESLKDFDEWTKWRVGEKTIHEMNKINFDNT